MRAEGAEEWHTPEESGADESGADEAGSDEGGEEDPDGVDLADILQQVDVYEMEKILKVRGGEGKREFLINACR